MKYNLDEKIDEALKISNATQKAQGFNICQTGADISTTNIQEVDSNESKCPETRLGSLNVYPVPSKDIIQPDIQKV